MICCAGGAALAPEAEKGFNEFGVKMLQGYGLNRKFTSYCSRR